MTPKKQKNKDSAATDSESSGTGIISRVFGAYYGILPLPVSSDSRELLGRLRGKFRIGKGIPERERLRHPVIVGDIVDYRIEKRGESGESEASIFFVHDRKGTVLRASPAEEHALGTNLDRAIVVVSIATPPPRSGFIDRFLASCYEGNVEGIIVFTKMDLLPELSGEESEYSQELIERYRRIGYRVFCLGSGMEDEIDSLQNLIQTGMTLFAGNSGAGKSTLINRLLGRDEQKIGTISESTGKGKHTTTNPALLVTGSDTEVAFFIDTPGVKEWGIVHMDRISLISSFPELKEVSQFCKFRNCDHSEGVLGCAVQELIDISLETDSPPKADEDAYLDPERFRNLEAMIESLDYPDRVRTGDYIKPTGRFRIGKNDN